MSSFAAIKIFIITLPNRRFCQANSSLIGISRITSVCMVPFRIRELVIATWQRYNDNSRLILQKFIFLQKNTINYTYFMSQLANRIGTPLQQDAIHAGKAEQHQGLACYSIVEIVVQNIHLAEQGWRRAVLHTLLPNVTPRHVLDLDERVERIAVEHELAALGIVGIHAFHDVDDIIQRNGGSGRLCIRHRSPLDDALGFALAVAAREVVVDAPSERLGKQP